MGMMDLLFGEEGGGGLVLARCLTHEVLQVREEASRVLKALVVLSDKVSKSVSIGLLVLLNKEAKADEKLNGSIRRQTENSEEGIAAASQTFPTPPFFFKYANLKEIVDADVKHRRIPSSYLRHTLPLLAQTNGLSITALTQLLILCYHPSLAASSKHGRKLWDSTSAALFKSNDGVRASLLLKLYICIHLLYTI
jgi:hypothetical protein